MSFFVRTRIAIFNLLVYNQVEEGERVMKKILTIILDGFGYREEVHGNAIKQAVMPNYDKLWDNYPHTILKASEQSVGLPEGQFGNSEVCHTIIGAGKILRQKQLIATEELAKDTFISNDAFVDMVEYVKEKGCALHIMGLLSDGGVHSQMAHTIKMLEHLKNQGIKEVYFHIITDGRDTGTHDAKKFIIALNEAIKKNSLGAVATICGRYYAMDRDTNYNRTQVYYDLITKGKGNKPLDLDKAINVCYEKNVTDEFLPPILINPKGLIKSDDALLWMNYRTDRAKQILTSLTDRNFKEFPICITNLHLYTLFIMDKNIPAKVFFEEETSKNPLGIYLSKLGLTQARISETEKFNHVTKFFDGEYTGPIEGCDKFLIPSPKVATYDLKPEMSAIEVTKKTVACLEKDYDFILLNYANPDMVGHTGKLDAAIKALQIMDECLGKVIEAAEENFYTIFLLSDHGNCDIMLDDNEVPVTTHTINPVPFIVTDKKVKLRDNGNLSNVAPTILKYMDIALPNEMKETKDLFAEE